jgi:hypothetical protein
MTQAGDYRQSKGQYARLRETGTEALYGLYAAGLSCISLKINRKITIEKVIKIARKGVCFALSKTHRFTVLRWFFVPVSITSPRLQGCESQTDTMTINLK